MVFAFLDPEGAEKKGKELLQKMNTAKRARHLDALPKGGVGDGAGQGQEAGEQSCDPFESAHFAKIFLERLGGVFVFDPNGDNAFLMGGNRRTRMPSGCSTG